MQYSPEFIKTEYEDTVVLSVLMPDGDKYTIWTLTKEEATENVMDAILNSFYLGVEAQQQSMNKNTIYKCYGQKWSEGKVTK